MSYKSFLFLLVFSSSCGLTEELDVCKNERQKLEQELEEALNRNEELEMQSNSLRGKLKLLEDKNEELIIQLEHIEEKFQGLKSLMNGSINRPPNNNYNLPKLYIEPGIRFD